MTTFKNPLDPDNIILLGKIKEWVRSKMNIGEESLVQVMEMNCMDPGCMDKETRILVTTPDAPGRQFRIHKPLVFVRQRDVDGLQV